MIDYKFSRITRDGNKTKVLVRFYEGEYKDIPDVQTKGKMVSVYVRFLKLEEKEFMFDEIKTDEELRKLFNKDLLRFQFKESINEQKLL